MRFIEGKKAIYVCCSIPIGIHFWHSHIAPFCYSMMVGWLIGLRIETDSSIISSETDSYVYQYARVLRTRASPERRQRSRGRLWDKTCRSWSPVPVKKEDRWYIARYFFFLNSSIQVLSSPLTFLKENVTGTCRRPSPLHPMNIEEAKRKEFCSLTCFLMRSKLVKGSVVWLPPVPTE